MSRSVLVEMAAEEETNEVDSDDLEDSWAAEDALVDASPASRKKLAR